jgi:predicted esterase
VSTPLQLHTGGEDEEVPVAFSVSLKNKLERIHKTVEYYNYPGGDHNIASPNFELAMKRSIAFFDAYLK